MFAFRRVMPELPARGGSSQRTSSALNLLSDFRLFGTIQVDLHRTEVWLCSKPAALSATSSGSYHTSLSIGTSPSPVNGSSWRCGIIALRRRLVPWTCVLPGCDRSRRMTSNYSLAHRDGKWIWGEVRWLTGLCLPRSLPRSRMRCFNSSPGPSVTAAGETASYKTG